MFYSILNRMVPMCINHDSHRKYLVFRIFSTTEFPFDILACNFRKRMHTVLPAEQASVRFPMSHSFSLCTESGGPTLSLNH